MATRAAPGGEARRGRLGFKTDEPEAFDRVEQDLLADRAAIPGAIDAWRSSTTRRRRWLMRRFASAEQVRPEFEVAFAEVPEARAVWESFSVTAQREILGTIDHLRFWRFVPRRWELRRVIRGAVLAGPRYPPQSGTRSH